MHSGTCVCSALGAESKPSLPGIHIHALLNIICQRHLHLHLIYGLIVVKDEMVFLNFVSIGSLFTVQPVSRRSQTKLIKSVQTAQCIPAMCRCLSDGNRRHVFESMEEKMYAPSSRPVHKMTSLIPGTCAQLERLRYTPQSPLLGHEMAVFRNSIASRFASLSFWDLLCFTS